MAIRFSAEDHRARAEEALKRSEEPQNNAVLEKVKEARKYAEAYQHTENKLESDLTTIMRCVYELHEQVSTDNEANLFTKALLNQEGIRTTKNTTNDFIPLMKLVLRKMSKTSISRYASVLAYARQNEVVSSSLQTFISDDGGIVKCEKAAKAFLKPGLDQKRAERGDAKLEKLRAHATPFPKSAITKDFPEGRSRVLIENQNGNVVVLSIRTETSVSGYKPFIRDSRKS